VVNKFETDAVWNPLIGSYPTDHTLNSQAAITAYGLQQRACPEYEVRHEMGTPYDSGIEQVARKLHDGSINFAGDIRFFQHKLTDLFKGKSPKRIRACTTGDLFSHNVPQAYIDQIIAAMTISGRNTYFVLTQFTENLFNYFETLTTRQDGPSPDRWDAARKPIYNATTGHTREYIGVMGAYPHWPPKNIWFGTSVRCQDDIDGNKIFHLQQTYCQHQFILIERLTKSIDITSLLPTIKLVIISNNNPGCDHSVLRDIAKQCEDRGTSCLRY
jgi:protein gp37